MEGAGEGGGGGEGEGGEVGVGVGGEEGVGMEVGEVEGVGGEVKGRHVAGEDVLLMVAPSMHFWLLTSRVSCVLRCPSLLLILLPCCILMFLVDLS